MMADVKRCRMRHAMMQDAPWRKSNITVSDNYAMLSGPKFGYQATGKVTATSLPYVGANYHVALDVLVNDDLSVGRYHNERWYVRLLEVV